MKQQTIKKSIKNSIKEPALFEPNYTLFNILSSLIDKKVI